MSHDEDANKAAQGQAALQARAVLSDLIDAAASSDIARLDSILLQEKNRHPDLGPQPQALLLRQYKDANGRTALHFACHAGQVQMVKHILDIVGEPTSSSSQEEKDAPPPVAWVDEKGETPLTLAVAGGGGNGESRIELVELLLSKGADPNHAPAAAAATEGGGEGGTARALHHAAAHNDAEVVKALLKAGADVEAQTETGTALHWASGEGAKDALQVLIDLGHADVNAVNKQGITPIILAAAHGCGSCVAALAKGQADVGFILSGGGLTALHMIAEYGSLEGVKAILETGAQGEKCALHESDNGKPVHLAAWGGHREVVEILLPYSDVKESVDELMTWGKAKALQYEEEQKQAHANNNNPHHHQMLPPNQDSHHPTPFPPPPASPQDEAQALQHKDEANRHFINKNYPEALALYTQAITLNGRDATFYSNRSGCYLKLNKPEEALIDAEMARRLKPDWPKACFRMAEARLALKRYEDAALAAYEGLQMDGGNEGLHKLLKRCIELGRAEHLEKVKKEGKEGKK